MLYRKCGLLVAYALLFAGFQASTSAKTPDQGGVSLKYNLPETRVVVSSTKTMGKGQTGWVFEVSTKIGPSSVIAEYISDSSIWSASSNAISKSEDGLLRAGNVGVDGKAGGVLTDVFKFIGSVVGIGLTTSSAETTKNKDAASYESDYAMIFTNLYPILAKGEATADELIKRLFDIQTNGPTAPLASPLAHSNAIAVVEASKVIQGQLGIVSELLKPLQQHQANWIQSQVEKDNNRTKQTQSFELSISDLPIVKKLSKSAFIDVQKSLSENMEKFKKINGGHILVRFGVSPQRISASEMSSYTNTDAFMFRVPRSTTLGLVNEENELVNFVYTYIVDEQCDNDIIRVPSSAWTKMSVDFTANQGLLLTAGNRAESSAQAVSSGLAGISGAATQGLAEALKISEVRRKLALESLLAKEEKLKQQKETYQARTEYLDTVAVAPANSEAKVIQAETALLDAKREKAASGVKLDYIGELTSAQQEHAIAKEVDQVATLEARIAVAEATKADKVELEMLKLQAEITKLKADVEKLAQEKGL